MSTEKYKIILTEVKNLNDFSFVKDKELKRQIEISFAYILYLIENIKNFWNTLDDDSLDYIHSQTINIYLGSIIEAILYEYVFEYLQKKDPSKVKRYCKNIAYIEKSLANGTLKDNYVICEKIEKSTEFKDDISFHSLINWVKDYKLLSENTIKIIDEIRQKRNIVHIKVLLSFKIW